MVSYGIYYALGFGAAGALITWLLSWPFAIPFYLLAAFCLNFFRDPDRVIPAGPYAVSPADGKVVAIKPPIGGKVVSVTYKKGQFLVASTEDASDANEQNVITVDGVIAGQPTRVVFKQIAGLIARRILCYVQAGNTVETGQRIGLMKFGSRMDVFLGPEWEVLVKAGQRVSGGSGILARMRGAA